MDLCKHQMPYEEVLEKYLLYYESVLNTYDIEYYPNVSMGWDSTPRTVQSEVWDWTPDLPYPFGNVVVGNTPEQFETAMKLVAERLMRQPQKHKILNINSWNEWTEGSYLEPDQHSGTAYLEAVKKVRSLWP